MLPWNSSLYNAMGVMQRVERLPLLQLRLVPCTVEPTFVNSGGFPGIGHQLRVGSRWASTILQSLPPCAMGVDQQTSPTRCLSTTTDARRVHDSTPSSVLWGALLCLSRWSRNDPPLQPNARRSVASRERRETPAILAGKPSPARRNKMLSSPRIHYADKYRVSRTKTGKKTTAHI